ncbi:Uncharacterized protein BP5553_09114 [Venustampulla echinocandica]|uniref:Uncharacterized protein n=1 Tax=Venustampulla echinocandica TaxID=2656787 RepID=A0A370TDW4_9HELO|nr:Uncharacterized protein BP5553_09114 [Venustampulla echinocandica]RDL32658.1 Uncharacterized protein BP5553_09114 [Venustampulla echinocandica]
MTSLLIALVACPALLASNEAIRQGQSKDRREEHRARRCNLIVTCASPSKMSSEIDRQKVVLKNNKLYISTGTSDNPGHPFAGYYLPYPDAEYEGIVSSITDVAPIMNWIYVDKDTYEVKYGVRVDAQPNITGPFSCTRQDRRMTLEGWEGFVAVKNMEGDGLWSLYFDRDDDGLREKLGLGKVVLEVELSRWEVRMPRPEGPQGWRKTE